MAVFDTGKHMISRGNVYNKITRRWLGPIEDFENVSEGPVITDVTGDGFASMTKADLVDAARDAGVSGFSTMSKDQLVEALEGSGDVAIIDDEAADDDGEDSSS